MEGNRGTVLIVDDDPAAAEVLTRLVERAGFGAEIATTAAGAGHAHARLHPIAMPRLGASTLRARRLPLSATGNPRVTR